MLLSLTASGQEWDKSDTQTITISNKLSARYQRRRRAVDRCSLATPLRAQYDGNEYEALPVVDARCTVLLGLSSPPTLDYA